MANTSLSLDDPSRIGEIRSIIRQKAALRLWYLESYEKYRACLHRCPETGLAVELGSGGGFVKEILPDIVTSDTISYDGIDTVVDATQMPFESGSLRALFMMNVFHHIPDAEAFFKEAIRCLKPGGRILMIDQHPGIISTPILKHAHHEPFDAKRQDWKFESSGPLSGANGALAWIVFQRDRLQFEKTFPELKLERYQPHTPLRYWLSGGLKDWSLINSRSFGVATAVDNALSKLSPAFGSFVDIELVRQP